MPQCRDNSGELYNFRSCYAALVSTLVVYYKSSLACQIILVDHLSYGYQHGELETDKAISLTLERIRRACFSFTGVSVELMALLMLLSCVERK